MYYVKLKWRHKASQCNKLLYTKHIDTVNVIK